MVDIKSLRKTVIDGIEKYLGCKVIRSNQNAHLPKYPYGSCTVTTVATANNGTYGEYADGISRKPVNTVISFTFRSDDEIESVTLANEARDWLDCAGTVYLNDNGVIVQSVTSISNRDNVLTVDYEYANGFDCFFWTFDKVENPASKQESIESVKTNIAVNKYHGLIVEIYRDGLVINGNITAVIVDGGMKITGTNAQIINGGLVIGG